MAQKAAAEAARKARNAVYGITYRQIEQYVIARYAECKNSRLMGSLAAAVRAGRMLPGMIVWVWMVCFQENLAAHISNELHV